MVETTTKINNETWAICPVCRHKIFKLEKSSGKITFEYKCHSCKIVSKITIGDNKNDEL